VDRAQACGTSARPASPRPERVRVRTLPELGPSQEQPEEPKKPRGPRQRTYPIAGSRPRLVDQTGLAFYLGLSTRSVRTLVTNGLIRPVPLLNHTRLYDLRDADHLIDTTKENA